MKGEAVPDRTRILIADDHALMREGIRSMVEGADGLEIVGEASDGAEAIELVRNLSPDLVLMDVRMPKVDGLEATRVIKSENAKVAILMVTTYEDPDYLLRAVRAGAAGYLLKDTARKKFLAAIRDVVGGDHPLDGKLAMELLKRIGDEKRTSAPTAELAEPLTPRETDIIHRLVLGETNPQISRNLHLSQSTVKANIRRILQKFGVSDRTQAAVRAIELGIVEN